MANVLNQERSYNLIAVIKALLTVLVAVAGEVLVVSVMKFCYSCWQWH